MARPYDISRKARADLKEIWNYTEDEWGEGQADKYYRALIQAMTDIGTHEIKGKPYPERPKYFRYRQYHHFIFYIMPENGRPFISRILHEARDFVARLDER